MKSVGIIGYGQMGRLLSCLIAPHFPVWVTDKEQISDELPTGVKQTELSNVARCSLVLICVPFQILEQTIKAIIPYLQEGTIVADITSIKVKPAKLMESLLPSFITPIATHPLFGPQSAKKGLSGLQWVVCPLRDSQIPITLQTLIEQKVGLEMVINTPEAHDQDMAYIQALTHLVGQSLKSMDLPETHLKTSSYQHMLELKGLLKDDSLELFQAIQKDNPYAASVVKEFVKNIQKLCVLSK